MASYSVNFKPSAEKDLRGLPGSIVARIVKQVEGLKSNPLPRQSAKLGGAAELYRMRIGDYRVVYGIDRKAREILVHYVRHRRDVYRRL
jgi:mRNA interferase RelE/StbE